MAFSQKKPLLCMLPAAFVSGKSAFVSSSVQEMLVGMAYVTLGAGGVFRFAGESEDLPPRACSPGAFLKILSRKIYTPAPAAPSSNSAPRATKGRALRLGEADGGGSEVLVADAGRGLATWAAEIINFESPAVGACGTTILRKQVGH